MIFLSNWDCFVQYLCIFFLQWKSSDIAHYVALSGGLWNQRRALKFGCPWLQQIYSVLCQIILSTPLYLYETYFILFLKVLDWKKINYICWDAIFFQLPMPILSQVLMSSLSIIRWSIFFLLNDQIVHSIGHQVVPL